MTEPTASPQTIAQILQQGLFHHRQGQLRAAMERYMEVLRINPEHAEALYCCAVVACAEGQFKEGVEVVRRAIKFGPATAKMYNLLGQALDRLGEPLEAIKAIDQAIALDPKLAAAHGNRANILVDAGMPLEALKSFDKAIALDPTSVPDLINRGALYESIGRPAEALKDYDKALMGSPGDPRILMNRGAVLKDLGLLELGGGATDTAHFAEAIASYDRAIKAAPRLHEAFAARGQIKMMLGDWAEGFADYDHRGQLPEPTYKALPDARWHGEERKGERIVLVTEQGLGDAIQFSQLAPWLAAQGHDVTLMVRPGLKALLGTLQDVTIVTSADELKASDKPIRWAPLMSVPGIMALTPDEMPCQAPYLKAEPARLAQWRDKLGERKTFRIGINWAPGHADRTVRSRRDIPLTAFKAIADLPGVELYALQKGAPLEEIKGVSFREKITTLDADNDPAAPLFLDTAAIIDNLDLVIGCDTAIVHLAGALGKPVFTAVPVISDWRWMVSRDDTPWYPTMRVFRQGADGDWAALMAKIAAAVAELRG
ncbi:MAG TPA: tetratricopeptide repeat-containing glycosyltransferase family protein [Pseudolabrys sp.]|nr:tetratricopeptide repeat-containing glycosyltransferase family protein [Pseudolabrys sp.]